MMFVSFSGIDGSGKSTQIQALCSSLEDMGVKYKRYTFWDDVVALRSLREEASHLIFKGERGVGSPEHPIQRRDKNVGSWYATLCRLCLYFLDAMKLRHVLPKFKEDYADVLILDRYFYDELPNLPLRNAWVRRYARLLLRIIPRPDIAFLLDADPRIAVSRKPEYPLDFVRQNREAYLNVGAMTDMMVLPPRAVDETAKTILNSILEKCMHNGESLSLLLYRARITDPVNTRAS